MGKIGNGINLSSSSTKKRQQQVFEGLSVKGVQRKMFHKVWRVVVGQLSALEEEEESKHQG